MRSKNWITCVIVVSMVAVSAPNGHSQEMKPKAMTAEEIRKELESTSPMKGEILHDGSLLCAFDSKKAQSMPEGPGFPEAAKRVQTGKNPKLVVNLSPGGDPQRLRLVKAGVMDGMTPIPTGSMISMTLVSTPKEPSHYTINFDNPLAPGKYEFAVMQGQLVTYLRCGLLVLSAGDDMQQYTDATNKLSFSYPAAWKPMTPAEAKQVMGAVTSKYLTVVLYDPKDWTQNINVQVLSPVAAQDLTEAAYREFLKGMDRQFADLPGFRQVSASVGRLGDMASLQYIHEWTRPDGVRLRQKQLRTGKAGREVALTFTASTAVYDEVDKTCFSLIVNTLKLD